MVVDVGLDYVGVVVVVCDYVVLGDVCELVVGDLVIGWDWYDVGELVVIWVWLVFVVVLVDGEICVGVGW